MIFLLNTVPVTTLLIIVTVIFCALWRSSIILCSEPFRLGFCYGVSVVGVLVFAKRDVVSYIVGYPNPSNGPWWLKKIPMLWRSNSASDPLFRKKFCCWTPI
jgi:hypothetical protein